MTSRPVPISHTASIARMIDLLRGLHRGLVRLAATLTSSAALDQFPTSLRSNLCGSDVRVK